MMRIYADTEKFVRSRIMKGFSQRELAKQAGISCGYISLIERSKKSVSPATAKKLSEILDKKTEELFRFEHP